MRKIKVAIIGINGISHAQQVIKSIRKQNDIFELVGYNIPEGAEKRFPKVAALFDGIKELSLEEILENPEIEAVVIETEEIYLTKYATLAAKHNKHIHMEKPGGVELCEFEALVRLMQENGKTFHIGYMYRYNPCVIELMDRVKNGELGKIISVEAQMNTRHTAENRQWLETFPGGIMFFLGCHLIDLILQFQGEPLNVIPLNRTTGIEGVTADDFGMAVFEYENGVSFAKVNAAEVGGFLRRQLTVSGELGTVELKPFEVLTNDGKQFTTVTDYGQKPVQSIDSVLYDRYDTMLSSFAKMVCGDMENPWSKEYELTLYKYVLKACGL